MCDVQCVTTNNQMRTTVKGLLPSLTDTSLQRSHFLFRADISYIHSYFNLSTTDTSQQRQRTPKLVTIKIISR